MKKFELHLVLIEADTQKTEKLMVPLANIAAKPYYTGSVLIAKIAC